MAVLVSLFVFLVQPVFRVRFFILPVDEIGPLVHYPHHYLWSQSRHSTKRLSLDIAVFKPGVFVANHTLLRKWSDILTVKSGVVWWKTSALLYKLKLYRFIVRKDADFPFELPLLPSRSFPYLTSLSKEENTRAHHDLLSAGFDSDKPFVTLVVRDPSYKQVFRRTPLLIDTKEDYRNQDIADFIMLPEVLEREGLRAVRMGARVERPFPIESEQVFDYATSGIRTELTDLYLMNNCKLCISTGLGLDGVSAIAGIPRVLINFFPYTETANAQEWELVLPVRIFDTAMNRELTFEESLARPSILHFRGSEELAAEGLVLVRARKDEIPITIEEALLRLDGKLSMSDSDLVNQKRYWEVLARDASLWRLTATPRPMVSPSFLRRYAAWLW